MNATVPPRLSVNVNKVATIRNSRGGDVPNVLEAVSVCIAAGAPGITVHPRADARHITAQDVRQIAAALSSHRESADSAGTVEYNIEGDPRPATYSHAGARFMRENFSRAVPASYAKRGRRLYWTPWPLDDSSSPG